jgi:hypothetical protein
MNIAYDLGSFGANNMKEMIDTAVKSARRTEL